jgi:hypothetical protein
MSAHHSQPKLLILLLRVCFEYRPRRFPSLPPSENHWNRDNLSPELFPLIGASRKKLKNQNVFVLESQFPENMLIFLLRTQARVQVSLFPDSFLGNNGIRAATTMGSLLESVGFQS